MTVDFLLPMELSSRNFDAYKKSSKTFCFVSSLPALCQALPNSPPPLIFATAKTPPISSHATYLGVNAGLIDML